MPAEEYPVQHPADPADRNQTPSDLYIDAQTTNSARAELEDRQSPADDIGERLQKGYQVLAENINTLHAHGHGEDASLYMADMLKDQSGTANPDEKLAVFEIFTKAGSEILRHDFLAYLDESIKRSVDKAKQLSALASGNGMSTTNHHLKMTRASSDGIRPVVAHMANANRQKVDNIPKTTYRERVKQTTGELNKAKEEATKIEVAVEGFLNSQKECAESVAAKHGDMATRDKQINNEREAVLGGNKEVTTASLQGLPEGVTRAIQDKIDQAIEQNIGKDTDLEAIIAVALSEERKAIPVSVIENLTSESVNLYTTLLHDVGLIRKFARASDQDMSQTSRTAARQEQLVFLDEFTRHYNDFGEQIHRTTRSISDQLSAVYNAATNFKNRTSSLKEKTTHATETAAQHGIAKTSTNHTG